MATENDMSNCCMSKYLLCGRQIVLGREIAYCFLESDLLFFID